jgi:hypothetical protein
MTYEQFWEQDCELVKYYREAAKISRNLRNQEAWLQGSYFYEALLDASPVFRSLAKKGTKPVPYRDAPYDMCDNHDKESRKRKQDKEDEKAKAYMQALAVSINRRFQKKEGDVSER